MSTVGNWRSPSIVKDGLVFCLDANSPNSFYPATAGTTWKDISGNNYHGTLTNGPTYDSSVGGNIVFDGVNDYINLPTDVMTTLQGTEEFTFAAWVKIDTTGSTNAIMGYRISDRKSPISERGTMTRSST